jgi:long-chain acyl-CoA synthetase
MEIRGFWKAAAAEPQRIAVIEPDGGKVAAGELFAAANQTVAGLRALGLHHGDVVAMALPNCSAVFELLLAGMQAGWHLVPINTHLTDTEMSYILRDSGARAFVGHEHLAQRCAKAARAADLRPEACFAVGQVPDFRPLAALRDRQPASLPADRLAGQIMQYTSGTTGRPKGVHRELAPFDPDAAIALYAQHLLRFDITPGGDHVHLCGSPMYHLAPLAYAWFSLHFEHLVVLMDHWTPQGALEQIARHRVTTTHMVPTQFHRLLQLGPEERAHHSTTSLRHVLHAAAPCPVEVKRRMLEWWGPVIYEYYGASEGGGTLVKADEWLRKPGTVGRPWAGAAIRILDDDGKECPPGSPGTVYLKLLQPFEYRGDPEKTHASRRGDFFTVGDVGYLDADGYLFLCDRKIDMIISGGVNIYPAEVEAVLLTHPRVGDAAVFGIPDDDWGERVKAVIEPAKGVTPGPELAQELLAFCAERLAHYKCPSSVDFVDALPRDPNGKLYKRRLRDPYWQNRERAI